MTFIEACGEIYLRELQKDHNREIENDDYMPQQAFSTCMGRGRALSDNAYTAVDNFRALCIQLSMERKHYAKMPEEEKRFHDIKKRIIKSSMPDEDIETAENAFYGDSIKRGWWYP